MDDRHAWRGLVHHLGQVGTLDAVLRVIQSVQVAGAQGGDGLGAHHHPRVLDDLEHLRDAVVDVADEPTDGGLLVAERDLTCGGDLQAHLLLDVRDVGTVALADLTGVGVEVELRHHEQRQSLGAGTTDALDADRAREDQVDDVVAHVVLGRGDEALDAFDAPRAVLVGEGLGGTGADIGTGVGLGEHHGRAPLALDHALGLLLLHLIAQAVQDAGEAGAGHVHEGGGVGAEHQLGNRPAKARRC